MKILLRSFFCLVHLVGLILSVVFLFFVDDPGFYNVWIWMAGSLIAHGALLVGNIIKLIYREDA